MFLSDQNNFIMTFQANHTYVKVAEICEMAGRQAAILVAMGKLGIRELKPEQERVINFLLEGHDAFAALPTGYGKSLLCNATTHLLEFLPGLV